jgi:hypothetical protein
MKKGAPGYSRVAEEEVATEGTQATASVGVAEHGNSAVLGFRVKVVRPMRMRRNARQPTPWVALAAALFLGPLACGNSSSPAGAGGNGGGGAAGSFGRGSGGMTGLGGGSGGGGAGVAGGPGGSGGGGADGRGGSPGGLGGSSGAGTGGHGGASGGGGASGVAGGAGAGGRGGSSGAGAGGHAGSSGAGAGGHAGSSAAGAGGHAGSGGTGGHAAFACNLVIGNSTTQQWFDSGFLTYPGIDPTRWQLIWVAHHYLDSWANPADAGWGTALDSGSTRPDRVIFIVTYSPPYPTEATYQTDLTAIVNNIQARYATVKRIEIMTLVRAPGNSGTACSSKANNEQSIPPAEDDAIAAVGADPSFAGLVFALPPAYVTTCSDFLTDEPQYTTTGATDIAQVYAAYYAAHP